MAPREWYPPAPPNPMEESRQEREDASMKTDAGAVDAGCPPPPPLVDANKNCSTSGPSPDTLQKRRITPGPPLFKKLKTAFGSVVLQNLEAETSESMNEGAVTEFPAAGSSAPSSSPLTVLDNASPATNTYSDCFTQCPELVRRLEQLGADRPVHVLRKTISATDVSKGQHRLLLPKAKLDKAALESMLTGGDAAKAKGEGLQVTAMDRMGREYAATLRLLASNNDYRIKGTGYWELVKDNGWQKDQILDVWLCRTNTQPRDEEGGAGNGGELRMVFLHHCDMADVTGELKKEEIIWTPKELDVLVILAEMQWLALSASPSPSPSPSTNTPNKSDMDSQVAFI